MTDPTTPPPAAPKGVTIPRGVLITAGVIALLLLVGMAVLVGVLVGSNSNAAPDDVRPTNASPTVEKSTEPAPAATQPSAPAEPEPDAYRIGDTFTTGNVTLTVHSVEILDSIPTVEGSPLTPDAGGQLVLIKTTYSNSKAQADLSCGNTDLYIQVFDTQEREMAPVFETYRIPGNPGCNDHLLQDTPHEWNIAFQSVAGAKPLAISVTETDKWLDPVWVDIQ